MSFHPNAVFLIGPTAEYTSISLGDNKSYLCVPYTENDIASYPWASSFIDCSGDTEWPDGFLGNKKGLGRLYEYNATDLNDTHMPLLAEKRIVTGSTLDVWGMNGDLPSGCEPLSSTAFSPLYATHWGAYPTSCAAETDDYYFIRDDFYPSPTHKSYIDIYRVHGGVESGRMSAAQSLLYDSMTVPPYVTFFNYIGDYYTLTWRSQHTISSGERATFIVEWSQSESFVGAQTATYVGFLDGDYYTASITLVLPFPQHWYFRSKRRDVLISDGSLVHESSWSPTTAIYQNRVDAVVYDNAPTMTPYYCYRDYNAALQKHIWTVFCMGGGSDQDQSPDKERIQVSDSPDFTTFSGGTYTIPFQEDGESSGSDWRGIAYTLPYPTVYYARVRYESADGLTYGPWSEVFALDGGNEGANAVYNSNYYTWTGWSWVGYHIHYVLTKETHWTGEKQTYDIASEALYHDGHAYVLLCRLRDVFETTEVTRDHRYGSLWLADYDGSAIALTQIGEEVEDWSPIGWSVHFDIVEFNDKLYAGWDNPADGVTNLYDWCEITGGVVGIVQHVAYPAEAPLYCNWATIAVIYGDLRVIASLDTDDDSGTGDFAYIMGIANILSDALAMKAYPNIKTGYTFTKDPWLESIWFDYTNYDDTETGICWLGSGQSNAIWFFGI